MQDWHRLLNELSLNRTTAAFAESVERLAGELGSKEPRFYLYDLKKGCLQRGEQSLPVDGNTLAGSCALYCERVSGPEGVALPVTRFGSLVGVLQGSEALPDLAGAAGMMLETIRQREQSRKCLETLQGVLVQVVDRVAPGGNGHTERVALLATELATLMDLSVQSRQELWDAAHYHDIGWLGRGGESETHAAQGAGLLERSAALKPLARLVASHHLRYPAEGVIPVEAWVLSLAEDLDEFFSQRRNLPLPFRTSEFYAQHAPHHHPEVVDALSGLVDSGRLAQIYA